MLMHAVVVHDRHVSSLPVVPDAVVDLIAPPVHYVERGFIDVAVLLRLAAGTVLLEVDMQRLRDPVFGLDVVAAVGLRPVDEPDLAALSYPRQGAQARELVLKLVMTGDRPHEYPVSLAGIMRFDAHSRLRRCRHYTLEPD